MEWKEVTLGEVSSKIGDGLHGTPKYDDEGSYYFINGNNLNCGKIIIKDDTKRVGIDEFVKNQKELNEQTILVSINGTIGNVAKYNNEPCILGKSACYINVIKKVDKEFIYYVLTSANFKRNITNEATGTTIKNVSLKQMREYKFNIPCNLADQRRIASILSSLDRKIELNNKINADLEEMAQAIFKNWFVDFEPFKDGKFVNSELGMIPEGWKVGRLTEIASYMNGLAMQKFPPKNNEDSLPVLKIKELGQGFCGSDSDRCSCNIKNECKIHNGDVIFSWSGTLLVDVWCGGDCGLNQHLFKVTSEDYPKWFYYYWTKHHLQEFIHIAKDKAVTMGHIKRGHLEEALVSIPDNDSMQKANELFEPILSKMIALRLESSHLSLLRDTLLPRLMSGEIEVPE
mgnify:FL=1